MQQHHSTTQNAAEVHWPSWLSGASDTHRVLWCDTLRRHGEHHSTTQMHAHSVTSWPGQTARAPLVRSMPLHTATGAAHNGTPQVRARTSLARDVCCGGRALRMSPGYAQRHVPLSGSVTQTHNSTTPNRKHTPAATWRGF